MILAIDSSSMVSSVALLTEDTLIAEYTINIKKTSSQTLLPMIDELFRMTGMDKRDIQAIAITGGPGSFTGLRIGAATAKGLALALGVDIISVPTIEAMAYNYNHCNKLICPIMDARRSQVYTGIYRCEEEQLEVVMPQCAVSVDELINTLQAMQEEVIFIGDGIPVFQKKIQEKMGRQCFFARQQSCRQKAAALGAVAWNKYKKGETVSGDAFAPEYLRMSQAERERLERNDNKKND